MSHRRPSHQRPRGPPQRPPHPLLQPPAGTLPLPVHSLFLTSHGLPHGCPSRKPSCSLFLVASLCAVWFPCRSSGSESPYEREVRVFFELLACDAPPFLSLARLSSFVLSSDGFPFQPCCSPPFPFSDFHCRFTLYSTLSCSVPIGLQIPCRCAFGGRRRLDCARNSAPAA